MFKIVPDTLSIHLPPRARKPALLEHLLLWGGLCFILWALLTVLLAPLWGQCLQDHADHIQSRIGFLKEQGLPISPSLYYFDQIGFSLRCAGGSLFGFFFFSLPIAAWLSLVELVADLLRGRVPPRPLRATFFVLSLLFFAPLINAYAGSWLLYFYAFALIAFLPPALKGIFSLCRKRLALNGSARKRELAALALMVFCFSGYLTHPVLHLLIFPERYENIDRATLVRDWLLLDEKGESLFNHWYYSNSPYSAEATRVTVFQPLIAAVYDLPLKDWESLLLLGIPRNEGISGSRALLLPVSEESELLRLLQSPHLGLALISSERATPELLVKLTGHDDEVVFVGDPKAATGDLSRFRCYSRETFTFKDPKGFLTTPLRERIAVLEKTGLVPRQWQQKKLWQGRIFGLFSQPLFSLPLLALCLLGAIFMACRILAALGGSRPLPAVLLALALAPLVLPQLFDNARSWKSLLFAESFPCPRREILELHRQSSFSDAYEELRRKPLSGSVRDPSDVKEMAHLSSQARDAVDDILGSPPATDTRIAMWRINALGNLFFLMEGNRQGAISGYLRGLSDTYPHLPVNYRYKYLETCARIRPLTDICRKLMSDETHLYIRWYGELNGFGTSD
ncbi:MAG: hypothetical protein HQL31_06615 [Planctomycetes bacterium]|nr:hypothetical protein [Planctomycetota bacterium]